MEGGGRDTPRPGRVVLTLSPALCVVGLSPDARTSWRVEWFMLPLSTFCTAAMKMCQVCNVTPSVSADGIARFFRGTVSLFVYLKQGARGGGGRRPIFVW